MQNERTIIYLMRHAQSIANETRVYSSKIDEDKGLSEFGKKQAEEAAKFFINKKISRIYTSPFKRAVQTSEAIAEALGKDTITEMEEFRELGCGKWDGYTELEINKKFPDAWKGWHRDPQNNPIPNGESLIEVQARALPALNEIIKNNRGKSIILVTHYCVFNVLICSLVSSLGNFRCFDTANATIAEINMENVPRLKFYSHPY